jgi:RNA polymerase sigma-70 factor (ECF subfamily)
MDTRLASRVDPSDVVQETLARAHRLLPDYLRNRPLPFFAWLRQLAWERLVDLHRHHVRAGRRSTSRELSAGNLLSDQSAVELAERLVASGTGPERALLRKELVRRVQAALAELADKDREVLLLRYVEQLSSRETAAILGISEDAGIKRHVRALTRLRALLVEGGEE